MKHLLSAGVGDIVTLAFELPLAGDRTPPTEFRIFPMGKVETSKGTFTFDEAAARSVLARWRDQGNALALDYDHAMVAPVALDPAEAGKAAGWFTLELREDGLYAVDVRWTDRAANFLRAGEYRYLSPAFTADKDGHVVGLINIALTNIPATKRMEPLVAANQTDAHAPAETLHMSKEISKLGRHINAKMKEHGLSHEELAQKCGMEPTALDELKHSDELSKGHRAKLKELARHLKTPVAHLRAMADGDEPDGDEKGVQASAALDGLIALTGKQNAGEALAAVQALKGAAAQAVALSARVEQLEAANTEREVVALVDSAVRDGKFVPAMRDHLLGMGRKDLATLKGLVEATPAGIAAPAGEYKSGGEDKGAKTVVTLTDDDRKAAKSLGITEETFLAHKQKVFPPHVAQ